MISGNIVYNIFLFYLPLLFALCVHEWAHAWVAKQKGDLTAFYAGRLSLNPIVHMDWIGTFLLPLIFIATGSPLFFGWAKPVPVDERALKNPKEDMFWIALAGPLSNMILSILSVFVLSALLVLKNHISLPVALIEMAKIFIYLNLFLCFFNLLPLHPLDGGKIAARFLPFSWNLFLEKNQYYLSFGLIALIISGGFHFISQPIFLLGQLFINLSASLAVLFIFL